MIPFATDEQAIAWLFVHLRDDHQPASVLVADDRMTGWLYEVESDHVCTGRCALVDYERVRTLAKSTSPTGCTIEAIIWDQSDALA